MVKRWHSPRRQTSPADHDEHGTRLSLGPVGASMVTALRVAFGVLVSILAALAGLLTAALLVLEVGGWNRLREPIERVVTARTGRAFSLHDLDVDLGLTTRIHLRGVSLANAPWARRPEPLFNAHAVVVDMRLPDLLRGRVTLPRLALDSPRLNLERRLDGRDNWTLDGLADEAGTDDPDGLRLGALLVRKGELRLHDKVRGIAVQAVVNATGNDPTAQAGELSLAAQGRYNRGDFRLTAKAGSLDAYRDGKVAYPLTLNLGAAGSRLRFEGTLAPGGSLAGVDGTLTLRGNDLAELYPLTGIVLPNSPPYQLQTGLSRRGDTVRLRGLNGTIGDSDTAGDLAVTLGGARPRLEGSLRSQKLDFDDLGTLFGGTPATTGAETASPAQKAQAKAYARDQRLLPDAPLHTRRLRAMDADVTFRAEAVNSRVIPMRDMSVRVRLDDGRLRVAPVHVRLPQGQFDLDLAVDGRATPAVSRVELGMRQVQVADLLPAVQGAPAMAGTLYGRAALEGRGDSVRAFAADADGRVGLAVNGGQVSHIVVELLGLDVAEALGVAVSGDQTVSLRCAAVALDVQGGVAKPQTFIIDTSDSVITAAGAVDLGQERLDLTLRTQSKDPSLLAGQAPVTVGGPLRSPRVGVAAGPLAGRGMAAVAVGTLLAPVAALLAFVDPGLAEDSDCAALLRTAVPSGEGTGGNAPAEPSKPVD